MIFSPRQSSQSSELVKFKKKAHQFCLAFFSYSASLAESKIRTRVVPTNSRTFFSPWLGHSPGASTRSPPFAITRTVASRCVSGPCHLYLSGSIKELDFYGFLFLDFMLCNHRNHLRTLLFFAIFSPSSQILCISKGDIFCGAPVKCIWLNKGKHKGTLFFQRQERHPT